MGYCNSSNDENIHGEKVVCKVCGKEIIGEQFQIYLPNGAAICAECGEQIVYYRDYMVQNGICKDGESVVVNKSYRKPVELKVKLDEYVVGQEKAKKILCTAVYNHYKRLMLKNDEIEKSNILLVGPTGSGKTYLIKTLAKLMDVPLAIADATTLTEAGYIGDDVETVLTKLLVAAEGNAEKAEHGIVFIDEIDKICSSQSLRHKEVGGKGVQQALLKLLEGCICEVPMSDKSGGYVTQKATTRIDTKNILFICGGAFPDVEGIIKKRINNKCGMGFGAVLAGENDKDDTDILLNVTAEDLHEFGMIPEFLGRLPVIAPLQSITVSMLKSIMTEPKNSIIEQYKKLMEVDEINLIFDDSALNAIAQKAIERNTGARSLRAILEDVLLDVMYYMPTDSEAGVVTITEGFVNGKEELMVNNRRDIKIAKY